MACPRSAPRVTCCCRSCLSNSRCGCHDDRPRTAAKALRETLERDPPYGVQVSFESGGGHRGLECTSLAPWLEESITRASQELYGRDAVHIGCGGSIPFMGMLGARFPDTQFFITGVLGPHANAHGPNEFLHIDYATKLTACVSMVLADHAKTVG